jgi:ribose transport system substrate-binding protein
VTSRPDSFQPDRFEAKAITPEPRRRVSLLVACGVTVAALAAAGTGSVAARNGADRTARASSAVALFVAIQSDPYDAALSAAAQQEAKTLGATVQEFDAGDDPETQASQCTAALQAREYKVFLLDPVSAAAVKGCATRAIATGIKVVAVDRPLGASYTLSPQLHGLVASVLSLPQTQYGALATLNASACAKLRPCNVAFFYGPTSDPFTHAGKADFLGAIKFRSNIHVVASASWYDNVATVETLTHALLLAQPKVNVITCDTDRGALAIVNTLKRAGKLSDFKVIGVGASAQAAAAIKSGALFGTAAEYPASIGQLAMELGVDAAEGKQPSKTGYDASYLEPAGPFIDRRNVAQLSSQWSG